MTMVKNVYENCDPMERILTLLQLVKTRPPRASIHNAPRKLVLFLVKPEERGGHRRPSAIVFHRSKNNYQVQLGMAVRND